MNFENNEDKRDKRNNIRIQQSSLVKGLGE
jgi:hypothetical protein